jgi:outer membrane protein
MLNQKLSNTNVKLQKSNKWYMPKISVNTGLNEALSQNFLWNDALPDVVSAGGRQFTYYLNFSVSFSLYNGGTYKRAIQNAIINREIGALNISDQKRTLFGQLDNQLATYQDQLNIIALNDQVIANAQQNLNISEERYKRALINSFDYRNVQLAYLRAALTRLESIYSLKVLETELTRLTGGFVTGE